MKMRNTTFILLSVLVLFSMCKKERDSPAPNNPNTGNGIDTTSNGSNGTSPRLVSFSPENGAIGDTISITGVNFTGNSSTLKVSFGNTPTKVVGVSTSTANNAKTIVMKVLVPEMADVTTTINVKTDTFSLTAEKKFTRIAVTEFTGFSPVTGYIGDTITITGTFYEKTPVVNFGGVPAKVISKDSKTLTVTVPDDIEDATTAISVVADAQTITSSGTFQLKAPFIEPISPTTVFNGLPMIINGKGFRNSYKFKQLYLDNSPVTFSRGGNNSISFTIKNVSLGAHTISVEVAGLKTQAKEVVNLVAPEITAITPQSVTEDDVLVIKGHNLLSPEPQMPTYVTSVDNNGNLILFRVLSNTEDEIRIAMRTLNAGQYKITVTVIQSPVTYNTPFTYVPKPLE